MDSTLWQSTGCSWSVMFVDLVAQDHDRKMCSLLSKESRFHSTDVALIPCTSYPAFALDDVALFIQTLGKVVRKLKGKYGFKHFLRDGYRISLKDPNGCYYKPAGVKLLTLNVNFPYFPFI